MSNKKLKLDSIPDYFSEAKRMLPPEVRDFYFNGAGCQITLTENETNFTKIRLMNKVLVDVSHRDTSYTCLGDTLSAPIFIAPMAFQQLACDDGEVASAAGAKKAGVGMMVSAVSTTSFSDVSSELGQAPWLQLYIYKRRDVTEKLVALAEELKFKAIVLTVDTAVYDRRYSESGPLELPSDFVLKNLESCGLDLEAIPPSQRAAFLSSLLDDSVTWDDVSWLQTITDLPIYLKGILNKNDAAIAAEKGVSGIVVSNHGGRQLDTVPSSIDVLPGIRDIVGDEFSVLFDGGIRRGSDIFKAIALGANGVLVGRPVLAGLAVNGAQGVFDVLETLKSELDITMALTGCRDLSEISRECLYS